MIINTNYNDYEKKITGSDNYNYKIFDKILKYNFTKKLNIVKSNKYLNINKKNSYLFNFFKIIEFYIKIYYFNLFKNLKKNIFFSSFLGKKNTLSLEKKFGVLCNFLVFFTFPNFIKKDEFDKSFRTNQKLNFPISNNFEKYIKENLFEEIPITYLEKYKYIKEKISIKNLKKQNIFSSVEHIEDDIIKIWIASKISLNSKLYIYDHSNSMRLSMYDFNHEEKISHKIISNLKYKNNKFISLPEIKFSRIYKNHKKNYLTDCGSIILYEGHKYSGKPSSCPSGPTNYFQFKQILNFYKTLNSRVKSKFKFKSPPYSDLRFKSYLKIKRKFEKKVLFDKNMRFKDTIQNSKIIVCTYPQTTLLEILILNKPFIILYPQKIWEFNKDNQQILNKLKKNGILFYDEKKAATHINKNWNEIELWWNSKIIQSTIEDIKKNNFKLISKDEWKTFFKNL